MLQKCEYDSAAGRAFKFVIVVVCGEHNQPMWMCYMPVQCSAIVPAASCILLECFSCSYENDDDDEDDVVVAD